MTQHIGIAVVLNEGEVLVGKRADDVPLPGMAEFPGGKCLADETPQQCAQRECLEESGVSVTATQLLAEVVHQYEHGTLQLHFWECQPRAETSMNDLPEPWQWVPVEELNRLEFPPANDEIITQLLADHAIS